MTESAVVNWPVIGLILAGQFIFAALVAALTRAISMHKVLGQTYSLVVLGVAGVVVIAGAQIGWSNVAFLAACFAVAAVPMGLEYYTRLLAEHKAAQAAREESIK
jgi:hypothetical protein